MSKWSGEPSFTYGIAFASWMLFHFLGGLGPRVIYILDPINVFCTGFLIAREWARLPAFGPIRWGESSLVGIATFALSLLVAPLTIHPGHALASFNPRALFGPGDLTYGLYFFHLVGLVIVAPLALEVFWRGFFMRYLLNRQFTAIPLGVCTGTSFLITTLLMALIEGPDWPRGLTYSVILGLWFVGTRSLGNAIAAHMIAQLALGLYVLTTKNWMLW